MPAQLIVTERCRGLYRPADGAPVAQCEHPVSHLADCGPDSIARPYDGPGEQPAAPLAAPEPSPWAGPTSRALRMARYIERSQQGRFLLHTTTQAPLMLFAALAQHSGDTPVSSATVAQMAGLARSTVDRHLSGCGLARKVAPGLWAMLDV